MRRDHLSASVVVVLYSLVMSAKADEERKYETNGVQLTVSDDGETTALFGADSQLVQHTLSPTTERTPLERTPLEPAPLDATSERTPLDDTFPRESDVGSGLHHLLHDLMWLSICPHFDHRSNDDFGTEFTGGGVGLKTSLPITDTLIAQFNGDITAIERETDFATQFAIGKLNRLDAASLLERLTGGFALEYYSRQPAGFDNWGGEAIGGIRLNEQLEVGAKTGFGFDEVMPSGVRRNSQTCLYAEYSPSDTIATLPYAGVDHDTDVFFGGITAVHKKSELMRCLLDIVGTERGDFGLTLAVVITPARFGGNPLNDGLGGAAHRLMGHGIFQLHPWAHRDLSRGF